MDSLQDLLAGRTPQEPPEIRIIRDFVRETFDEPVSVSVAEREIVILVGSSSLASALRARTVEILQKCDAADKRLVLRIARTS